jgi:glycosyltransferase involved in cell wall biosynthesis
MSAAAVSGLRPGVVAAPSPPPAPPSVLLVVDSLDCGGAERYVVDLARSLAGRGHAVTVACSTGGPLRTELDAAGIPVAELLGSLVKRRASPRFALALRRLVRELAPDVVHAHIYASAAAAALATWRADVPLVVTEHTEAPWRGPGARALSRWLYGRADELIAVSDAIRDMLEDRYGVPAGRVSHLVNAIAPVPLPPGAVAPALPARARGRHLVGRVSRLAPEKGCDVFLRAAARLAARDPTVHFLVVGDGPERPRLEALVAELGLGDRVDLLGLRADARAVIAELDVLVVSSLSDGAPLVVLEAMEAEVPVVASAVGGLPDQIDHGADGLLVPPGDDEALAAAVAGLLRDPARRRALGAAGRERVGGAGAGAHDRLVAEVEAVYQRALR